MMSDWRSMDDNRLRAHLDSALSEREGCLPTEDFGYSDEEFHAITHEVRQRRWRIGSTLQRGNRRSEASKGH